MDSVEQTHTCGLHFRLQAPLQILKTESAPRSPTSLTQATMSSSSFTIKSLSNAKLDALLASYGAATFGSAERKRERLQRFINAQVDRDLAASRVEIARQAEQNRAQKRTHEFYEDEEPAPKRRRIETVAAPAIRRSARLAATRNGTCPSPSHAPAPSPVRRPAPPSLPGTDQSRKTIHPARAHRMMTRSQMAETRPAAREALSRIQALIAAFLA